MDFTLLITVAILHCTFLVVDGTVARVNVGIIEIIVVTLLIELYLVLWCIELF